MASIKFNPFTGKFDYVGSGGGVSYIDGVCDDFSALPITLGSPALESVYLVRNGSGVWLINRKPAGLYIRDANNGNLDDWRYLSAFPEVNDAQYFRIYDSIDPTKEIAFSASGISSGTVRTLTAPNKNITIADNADIPTPSTATPSALGTAAAGTSTDFARGDHVHSAEPSDSAFRVVGSSDATKKVAFEVDTLVDTATTRTLTVPNASGTLALTTLIGAPIELIIACSDETTSLTTGAAKANFRAPCAFTLTAVRASVNTAPTGSTLIVDINEAGSTVLSTKLSIDASEKTSTTAASAAVISDSAIADDAEITIDIDQIGSTIAGKGLKVTLIGTRA